jgi:ABC-type glycerol-3-phosphate transport system substrate-binding protein
LIASSGSFCWLITLYVSRAIWTETYNVINQQKEPEEAINDLAEQLKDLM